MEENIISVFKEGVIAISEGIRNLAPQVWDIMVRQQIITGYTNFVVAFSCLFAIITILIVISVISRKMDDDEDKYMTWVIGGLIIILPFVLGIYHFIEGIKMLFNPEYYALMDLKSIILP